MRMKKLLIVAGAIVTVAVTTGGVIILSRRQAKVVSPIESQASVSVSTPAPTQAASLATWDDPAGFSFQYPKELTVNKHEEDNDNYAHVELTTASHQGNIIVWVKDLPTGVTTLDTWVKKIYPSATSIDTKLGGEPAKKILVSTPVKKLTVGTISEELLFMVEGTLTDAVYWQNVHDTITNSFAFTPESSTGQAASGQTAVEAVDEEETVQ
jgi:hypothetical protein